ncbi:transposon Tf2-6 polyprotein [Trichonephila clavipes]|nr:transposon Tf2-6 polyprotein [Trichonephila clavipes]
MKDDISLNLTLFERHAELTFFPKKDWVLIPIDIAHLIAREPADKCNDYNHVKSYCKGPGHYAVDCTKRSKSSKTNNSTDSSIQICSRTSRERIKTRKITTGSKITEALIDSGISVSLIREDVSKVIIEPSRLSKDIAVLFGLEKYEVRTKGSFQRKIELDGEEYSLTWHVVPTPSLEFQAVIGSDI